MLAFLTTCLILATVNGQNNYPQCLTAYSCANEIINGSFWLNCYGVGSCLGASINNIGKDDDSKSTSCSAARACQYVSTFDGTVEYESDIRGFLGLAWTQDILVEQLNCLGEAACYQVKNATSRYIRCRGFRACDGLQGRNTEDIVGNGVLALENSILHNPSRAVFNGFYAGQNATVYCDYGYNCTIVCKVNGCENLNLICGNITNPKNCSQFDANLPFIVEIDEEDNGVAWPNGYQSTSTSTGSSSNNNNISNINSNIVTNYYNRFNQILAHFSNDKIDFTLDYSTTGNDDYLSDPYYFECDDSDRNDVLCQDYQQCSHETYSNKNNICCSAESTCVSTNISSFINVYCDARYSCRSSIIDGKGTGNIYIRSKKAWIPDSPSLVKNFNSMMVTGHDSIWSSEIINGNYLACFGSSSCQNLTITSVKNIYAGGGESIFASEIISGGIGEMNVYFMGGSSAKYSSIVCSDDDICNIYCVTDNSCDGFTTKCLDGASCLDRMKVYLYTLGETETLSPTNMPSDIISTDTNWTDTVSETTMDDSSGVSFFCFFYFFCWCLFATFLALAKIQPQKKGCIILFFFWCVRCCFHFNLFWEYFHLGYI